MEFQSENEAPKTPFFNKLRVTIRLLAGFSMAFALAFLIWGLLFEANANSGAIPPWSLAWLILLFVAPFPYALLLEIKTLKTNTHLAFSFSVAYTLFEYVFLIILLVAFSFQLSAQSCTYSIGSSSSMASQNPSCPGLINTKNNLVYSGLALAVLLLVQELFGGLEAFWKKDLSLGLYFSSLLVIGSALWLTFSLGSPYYWMFFFSLTTLTGANDLILVYGQQRKTSPFSEDVSSNK